VFIGVDQLVLVEGIRPPFLEFLGLVGPHRRFPFHEHDLALDIQSLVLIIAEFRGADAVPHIDDLGRDFTRSGCRSRDELILIFIIFLDDAFLDGYVEGHFTALQYLCVGIREFLKIGAVFAPRADPPMLEQRNRPFGAFLILLGAAQPAAVFFRTEFLEVFEKFSAFNTVKGFQPLLFVGWSGPVLRRQAQCQQKGQSKRYGEEFKSPFSHQWNLLIIDHQNKPILNTGFS